MTQPLSPAAQAVLRAAEDAYLANDNEFYNVVNNVAAAALRALADQVVPEHAEPVGDEHDAARADQWLRIRLRILAIATELENNQ